jgi:hypothetical protein
MTKHRDTTLSLWLFLGRLFQYLLLILVIDSGLIDLVLPNRLKKKKEQGCQTKCVWKGNEVLINRFPCDEVGVKTARMACNNARRRESRNCYASWDKGQMIRTGDRAKISNARGVLER